MKLIRVKPTVTVRPQIRPASFRRLRDALISDVRSRTRRRCKTASVFHERFDEAAARVLTDDSMEAARSLEGVVLNDYPGDERLDDLLEALALYNPGEGPPYVNWEGLRCAVRAARTRIGASEPE
jgi:hypothetical protein